MLPAFCRRWLPLVVSPVAVSATDTGVPVLTVHVGAIEKGAVHRAVGTSCSVLLLLRLDEGPDQAVTTVLSAVAASSSGSWFCPFLFGWLSSLSSSSRQVSRIWVSAAVNKAERERERVLTL